MSERTKWVMPRFWCLESFAKLVVPTLQERGLFSREYTHRTLRGRYGLPGGDPDQLTRVVPSKIPSVSRYSSIPTPLGSRT